MKIRVPLTLEIDNIEDWTLTFGVEGHAAVRWDICEYVKDMVENGGVFGSGEVDVRVSLNK